MQYSGKFDSDELDAPFLLSHYFGTHPFNETFSRDGITMTFRGWTRPIETYCSALFGAGFVVDGLSEPVPSIDNGRYERWHRFPMFLHLRAIKQRS